MLSTILFFGAFLSTVVSGQVAQKRVNEQIITSFDPKGPQAKYAGVVLIMAGGEPDCTGSLIDHEGTLFVLTAAHCFWDRDTNAGHPGPFSVYFGPDVLKLRTNGNEGEIKVTHIEIDGRFKTAECPEAARLHDIAILTLDPSADERSAKPFALRILSDPLKKGMTFYHLGYGRTYHLHLFTTKFQNIVSEEQKHSQHRGLSIGGDSGGPVLDRKGKQVAILTSGNDKKHKVYVLYITAEILANIHEMMDKAKKANPKKVSLAVEAYDDDYYGHYGDYDGYDLYKEARNNLLSARVQFEIANRLLNGEKEMRRQAVSNKVRYGRY